MDTEGYIRIINIRLNNYNDHALTNLPTSPQVGTGGSRVRREHDTERIPSCEGGPLPYNNTSCPSKRRGMSDNTKDKSRVYRDRHSMPAYSTYTPGMKRGGIKMNITQYDTTLIQERTAPEMRRRRCIRLRPRMGNIQRRERTGISPRKRGSSDSKGRREKKSTKEAVLAGLRIEDDVLREAKLGKLNNNIGCSKNITYNRGGARKDKMAKACRRFPAGERATARHIRTEHRGDTRQQEDHEVCKRDPPQEPIDKAKPTWNRIQNT